MSPTLCNNNAYKFAKKRNSKIQNSKKKTMISEVFKCVAKI
jgi:hypothetical protein